MKNNENIHDDNIQRSAPKLFSVNKENPFDVPENYFENLQGAISDKCTSTEKSKTTKVVYRRLLVPIAVAASIVLIVFIINKRNNIITPDNSAQYAYTETDASGTSAYLNDLIENNELDEDLIVTALTNDDTIKRVSANSQVEENINKLNNNPVVITDSTSNVKVTEDDIIDYLLENYSNDEL